MSQKNLFFEGSAHVPLLIMPPQGRSLPQNISVEAPTDLVDLYPTILAMAGLSSPVSVSGRNLLEPVPMDRIFFGNSLNRNFCVMEEKVKLVYSAVGDHVLLFDLNTDPMEQHNLSRGSCLAGTQGKALEASAGAYRTVYARGAGREGSVPYLRSPPLPRRCARTVVWFPLS